MLTGRSLIDITDLSRSEVDEILDLASAISTNPKDYGDLCKGKILATLFFEPSTRTRLSFESAMLRLGGAVEGFATAQVTSSTKGETLSDTATVVSNLCDVIAIRHPKEGAALVASRASLVPVINAGDGGHCHPTQTLTDLVTINSLRGSLSNLTIGFCGDLTFGRTVHSLVRALRRYSGINFIFISPKELSIPPALRAELTKDEGLTYSEVSSLEEVLPSLDVLYMTRVQQERFVNLADYERLKDYYILTRAALKFARPNLLIMHPLPRVNEIARDVDSDPRAAYFKQVRFGLWARMALLSKVLGAVQ